MLAGQYGLFTEEEARKSLLEESNAIQHLVYTEDNRYGILWHINCSWCQFCESQGDCRGNMDADAKPYEPMELDND